MSRIDRVIPVLRNLGFSEYEARCFVALTQLGEATASEISHQADVPQPRIYDVADRLHERGLIDIQESEPRRFLALSVDAAIDQLRAEFEAYLEGAASHRNALDGRNTPTKGVWGLPTSPISIIVRRRSFPRRPRQSISSWARTPS